MASKKKNYCVANVLFENNHESVLALETNDSDVEMIKLHFEIWARAYVGMRLEILRISACSYQDYKEITTKISW